MARPKPGPLRRGATYAGLAFITGWGVWQWALWKARTEPTEVAARKIVDAFRTGDKSTLWYYSDLGEKSAFDMDEAKFYRFFDEYVFAQTSRQDLGRIVATRHGPSFNVMQYMNEAKHDVILDFVVFPTPNGPRANVMAPGFQLVFEKKYGARHNAKKLMDRRLAIMEDGIIRERKILEGYGITGVKDNSPNRGPATWDQVMQVFANKRARDAAQAKQEASIGSRS